MTEDDSPVQAADGSNTIGFLATIMDQLSSLDETLTFLHGDRDERWFDGTRVPTGEALHD